MEVIVEFIMLIIVRELLRDGLFLHELMHGIVAIPVAYLMYRKTKSFGLALFTFVASFLIDLDHLVDYFAFYGFRFNLLEFLRGEQFEITQKAYIPLHAWELLVILGIVSKKVGWKSCITALTLGFTIHVIFDAIVWGDFLFYSIIYRTLVSNIGL